MKCGACGYEYEVDYKRMERVIIKGNEDFIDIKGTFYIENNSDDPYREKVIEASLIACPKCKTVILSN